METINAVKTALEIYHDVIMIEANADAFEKLRNADIDIVFNIAENENGISREAQIPAIMDMLKIPYTGSDPLTLAICLDKSRTKEILSYYGIKTPKFLLIQSIDDLQNFSIDFPVFVKPVAEGSSKGIFNSSYVSNFNELEYESKKYLTEYNQPCLVEEYLPGREFTVAMLGNGNEAQVLPIIELNFEDLPDNMHPIYSFEAKWILDTKENPMDIYTCPAKIDEELRTKINELAHKSYNILRCKDWSRLDVRLDKYGEPNIIEINPLPGILPDPKDNSCFPKAARSAGIEYDELINRVLYYGAKRHNLL
ncbi:MAG: ATP-grasp domain-containing protein [Bacteroidetes bacterium]|nr:ATP-grasp domain-containing protein [Bacteroidota bacterium]